MSAMRPMTDQCPQSLQELKRSIAEGKICFSGQVEQVARRMLEHPEMVAFESAATVAKKCGVSQTTVIRLSSLLGIGSYRGLKDLCASYIRERSKGVSPAHQ
ncbi:hypothetical protein ATY77_00305 [Rhizobium sp. R634]|uniref:MurR/RpiR family transcriptional regulator n=1 Tax=Rhizobium sp. R634 TaxID=1764274 RepID=UPI000B53204C|nr:hypothetical protein [Rhizobium sp. R634]OWV81732.1 hypothetical protein ATY77_00305 [Rhizobium sp. R634]